MEAAKADLRQALELEPELIDRISYSKILWSPMKMNFECSNSQKKVMKKEILKDQNDNLDNILEDYIYPGL